VRRLRLFVYGTLRRGGRFHDRYCRGAVSITEAEVRGTLGRLAAGYPALIVPETEFLARGSEDPRADLEVQERIAASLRTEPAASAAGFAVAGEVLELDDPATRLPAIDRLEDFRPGLPSLYERVLLPVRETGAAETSVAWVYVCGNRERPIR
jgi:gamma-glutamylcyclotransferase (GGCT)/AIG2-like uncharacterized protein YtfP